MAIRRIFQILLAVWVMSACTSTKQQGQTTSTKSEEKSNDNPSEIRNTGSKKSVEKQVDLSTFESYVISKGNQRATMSLAFVTDKVMKFEVYFDASAMYQTQNKNNQADINKLYGFSDCFSAHQENSARFGWRWYNDRLELLAYCYQNGKRNEETLLSAIELNRAYRCEIEAKDDKYIFKLDNIVKEVKRGCGGNPAGYKLYPYFGGDEFAPHDITIRIKDL